VATGPRGGSTGYEITTFDCYGALIDWESGISDAIFEAASSVAVEVCREEIMKAYLEVEQTLQAMEYRSYRDILGEAASRTANLLGWTVEPEHACFLAESLPTWRPFADTNSALEQLEDAGHRFGILSNIDEDLLAGTLRHFSADFGLLITAQLVRSYKPAFTHFLKAREALAGTLWLHAAQSYFHNITPACDLDIPVV